MVHPEHIVDGSRHAAATRRLALVAGAVGSSLLLGVLAAVLPTTYGLAFAGLVAVVLVTILIPENLLVYLILLCSIFGFAPLPNIAGYQIELEYPIIVIALIRVLMNGRLAAKPWDPRWRPVLLASGVLICATAISAIYSLGHLIPSMTTKDVIVALAKWLAPFMFLLVLVARRPPSAGRVAQPLLIFLLVVIVAYSLVTILASAGSLLGIFSQPFERLSFSNQIGPNRTGIFVDVALIAAATLGALRWHTILSIMCLVPLTIVLLLAGSREALVTLAVVGIYYLVNVRPRRILFIMLILLVLVLSIIAISFASDPSLIPLSFFRTPSYASSLPTSTIAGVQIPGSLAVRLYIAEQGVLIFLHHPLLGLGYDQPLNITVLSASGIPVITNPAHDSFISIAAQQGLLGVIPAVALTGVFLYALSSARSKPRPPRDRLLALALRSSVLVLLVDSFSTDLLYFDVRAMILVMVLIAAILDLTSPTPERGQTFAVERANPIAESARAASAAR